MSKDNREELKPCPFCGDKIRYRKSDGKGVCKTTHYINCDNCGLEMFDITEKGLIDNWNWRNGEVTIDSGADANGWISVDDRLPELTEIVLVYYWDEIIDRAWYRPNGKFYLEYNGYTRIYGNEVKPTHWQPLPKPPITIKGK